MFKIYIFLIADHLYQNNSMEKYIYVSLRLGNYRIEYIDIFGLIFNKFKNKVIGGSNEPNK